MVLKVHNDDAASPNTRRLENMHIAFFPEMGLFTTEMRIDGEDARAGRVVVIYHRQGERLGRHMEIPLRPETSGLATVEVVMHSSPTKAYDMGARYNRWFSDCFGYEVVLVYLGENLRAVLGNLSPNAAAGAQPATSSSWLSSITNHLPVLGTSAKEDEGITFADCAPFLVVTEESLADVSSRLPAGEEMDITKLRPNIVLSGSTGAWDEDFWGGIRIREDVDIILTQNCVRCVSLNVDYATGKPGTGEAGSILKKLMKDRRVDPGTKYSPVFGRYGFLAEEVERMTVAIGDEVTVTKKNAERTQFGRFQERYLKVGILMLRPGRLARLDELMVLQPH